MEKEQFTVDVTLDDTWLVAALKAHQRGENVRVSVVISTPSLIGVTYKVGVSGGGDVEYGVASVSGDLTAEEWWPGDRKIDILDSSQEEG